MPMVDPLTWVLLAYRLPREPSTPRIAVWRTVRRLGAAQVLDGLVALPADARTREQFEWLADEVIAAGGEATLWVGTIASVGQERGLVQQMADRVAAEYAQVIADAAAAHAGPDPIRRRTSARLRRELHRIWRRDFFPPPERAEAVAAVADLAQVAVIA